MALRGLLSNMQTSCCISQRLTTQARHITLKFQLQTLNMPVGTFRYMHQYQFRMQLSASKLPSRCSTLHTTATVSAFGIHEIADALSHHPAIVAVTGGSGLGLASMLYRSPAFWKLIASASTDRSVLLLPPKPSHSLQSRKTEIRQLDALFRSLRKRNRSAVSVAVYVTGRPGYGKTQLAREFGKEYYKKKRGFIFKNLFVGTLNAASKSSFLQSYITLALELGCASELKVLEDLSGRKGELQSLELLAATVRKELKKRPGWLLIVDNLSSDVNPNVLATPQFSEVLPAVSPATLPFSPPGQGMLKGDSYSSGFGIAAAYGVGSYKAAWRSFWPQSGDESWGKGYVLVTTNDRRLVERSSPFASELFLSSGMVESDAVSLLEKVSECKGEGAREVVTALDKAPLSIASAGFYISAERSRNPSYSFNDYREGFEKDIQTESEKMLLHQNLSYPVTMTMAVSMATQQLAIDPHLHKVFLLLASCAQSPVPMSLIAKVLSVRPDINSAVLESVRNCALLFFPKSHDQSLHGSAQQLSFVGDDIETVSLYRGTREVFRELLLGENVSTSDPSMSDTETTQPLAAAGVQQRNAMLRHFIDCLVQEYEAAKFSDSVSSYRLRHLLLPHMEAHLQAADRVPGFHLDAQREIDLCYSLGSGFLLVGRPRRAREVLERALKVCEDSGGKNSIRAADIASVLGRTYRHLALLKESEFVLEEALRVYEKKSGEVSAEVAGALTNLSSTYKYRGLYHDSRKCLEQALEIYEKLYHSKHPSVAHVLTNLGATWRNLGDSMKSKELFEKALAIQEELYEPYHPAIAVTLGNLSVSYSDLGQPQKGIELLQRALEINRHVHNPDHFSVAITLSNLSIAHRHLGDVTKSKELAMEALRKTEATHGHTHPGVAIALGILGTTYSDLGELTKAQELLETSVEINKAINGLRHAGTAIAQTQLGRVMRLAGKLQDAKQILETALETKEKVYGTLHPGIGVTLNSIGKVYHELGFLTQSQLAFLRSQSIGEKLYHNNPDHPQIAFGKADLAKVIRDCGDIQRSAEMMQDAIDHYTETSTQSGNPGYTTAHPKYASMLAVMGLILRDLDDLKGAKKYLEKALRIQHKILSQQNLMKADTVCTLATVLHRLGEQEKALDKLNGALAMMQSTCYQNPVTSTISGAIAALLLDMGEIHSAKHCLTEALKIRTKCCGETHPAVAHYHKLLADVDKEDTPERMQHLRTSRKIYTALCERESILSEEAGLHLPVVVQWRKTLEELEHQLK